MKKKEWLALQRAVDARLRGLRSADLLIERLAAEGRTFEEYLAGEMPIEDFGPSMDEVAEMFADLARPTRSPSLSAEIAAPPIEPPTADWAIIRKTFDKAIAKRDFKAIYATKVAAQILLLLGHIENQ
jgi:hypothetical protein